MALVEDSHDDMAAKVLDAKFTAVEAEKRADRLVLSCLDATRLAGRINDLEAYNESLERETGRKGFEY